MKKVLAVLAGLMVFSSVAVATGGSPVLPATCTLVNCRGENTLNLEGLYTRGDTVQLTNCVGYVGTSTNTAVQQLTNVTVRFTVGYPGAVVVYTGSVQNATLGLWQHPGFTVPTNGAVNIEVQFTDENSKRYTYGWKLMSTQDPLK